MISKKCKDKGNEDKGNIIKGHTELQKQRNRTKKGTDNHVLLKKKKANKHQDE